MCVCVCTGAKNLVIYRKNCTGEGKYYIQITLYIISGCLGSKSLIACGILAHFFNEMK